MCVAWDSSSALPDFIHDDVPLTRLAGLIGAALAVAQTPNGSDPDAKTGGPIRPRAKREGLCRTQEQ
jgi:hypothetical protein